MVAPPEAYADFTDLLTKLWLFDAELCTAIVKQPWLLGQSQPFSINVTVDDKRLVIESLHGLALADRGLAQDVADVSWLTDEMTYWEAKVLIEVGNLATKDADLARMIAGFRWFIDGSFQLSKASIAISELHDLSLKATDIGLARAVAGLWLEDGVSELPPIGALSRLALVDIELALQITALSWFTHAKTGVEQSAISNLVDLVSVDVDVARQVANLSWFTDGITWQERSAIEGLANLATQDVELARQTVYQPWFIDGITAEEATFIRP